MSLEELAELVHIEPAKLREWAEAGLLDPRGEGRFDDLDLLRLMTIKEYEALGEQRRDIDNRLAHLAQTIGTLSKLLGLTPTVPMSITDAVRLAMRAGVPMTPAIRQQTFRAPQAAIPHDQVIVKHARRTAPQLRPGQHLEFDFYAGDGRELPA